MTYKDNITSIKKLASLLLLKLDEVTPCMKAQAQTLSCFWITFYDKKR